MSMSCWWVTEVFLIIVYYLFAVLVWGSFLSSSGEKLSDISTLAFPQEQQAWPHSPGVNSRPTMKHASTRNDLLAWGQLSPLPLHCPSRNWLELNKLIIFMSVLVKEIWRLLLLVGFLQLLGNNQTRRRGLVTDVRREMKGEPDDVNGICSLLVCDLFSLLRKGIRTPHPCCA